MAGFFDCLECICIFLGLWKDTEIIEPKEVNMDYEMDYNERLEYLDDFNQYIHNYVIESRPADPETGEEKLSEVVSLNRLL